MRSLFFLFYSCRWFGHWWGYTGSADRTADAEGWFILPSGRKEARICWGCALHEMKDRRA